MIKMIIIMIENLFLSIFEVHSMRVDFNFSATTFFYLFIIKLLLILYNNEM